MPVPELIKSWFRALEAAIEAVEEGPYGYMAKRIDLLNARISKLENEAAKGTD